MQDYQILVPSFHEQNTSIALGDHFADFVETQVASGRFSSASGVVRARLRLREERNAKLAALRNALVEGEKSRPARSLEREAFLARMKAKPDAKRHDVRQR